MKRVAVTAFFLLASCASTPPRETPPIAAAQPLPPISPTKKLVESAGAADEPVGRGELPWWHDLKAGTYQLDGKVQVLAVGESAHHHHIAEGFLQSKVMARLAARRAAESVRFVGTMPEPQLLDLFVTRKQRFLALYFIMIPPEATQSGTIPVLTKPNMLRAEGRRRVGRHVYESGEHLYLECDVEGPIANPDWGRSRAATRY